MFPFSAIDVSFLEDLKKSGLTIEDLKSARKQVFDETLPPQSDAPMISSSIGVYQIIGSLRDRLQYMGDQFLIEEGFKLLDELEAKVRAFEHPKS